MISGILGFEIKVCLTDAVWLELIEKEWNILVSLNQQIGIIVKAKWGNGVIPQKEPEALWLELRIFYF